MARKNDYTGDVYGDFVVLRRANARNSKRYWWVAAPDGTEFEMAQTDLAGLERTESGTVPTPRPVPAVGSSNPFSLVVTDDYHDERDSDGLIYSASPAAPLDPAWTEQAVALHNGPKLAPKSSAEITASVLAANKAADEFVLSLTLDEALASVELDDDPECQTISLQYLNPFSVLVENFPDEVEIAPVKNVVTRYGGIGEAAEETVSEQELDKRASEAGQSSVRLIIRTLMGEVHSVREKVIALTVMADGLMDMVDALLKADIERA